jgi:peptidylprolyl isomerase
MAPIQNPEGTAVLSRAHTRFLPAVLLAAAVALAGCGHNASSGSSAGGSTSPSPSSNSTGSASLADMKISGGVGNNPTVTFTGKVDNGTQTTTKVLIQGHGPVVNKGDSVILHSIIADGATQKTVANSYTNNQPEVVSMSSQVQPLFLNAITGKKVGSRVLVAAPAATVFQGQGNPSLGIGDKDTVLIVFDLVGKPLSGPNGASHQSPGWAPKVVSSKGVVTTLDFAKTPKPNGKLRSATLRTGTGPVVKKGQTIVVHYLGEVYKSKQPFDQNFNTSPTSFQIGVGRVVKGWDKTLVGQHVGSEVVVSIPPKDGYGKQGNSQAGIKGTDTLYFVVDILGAA